MRKSLILFCLFLVTTVGCVEENSSKPDDVEYLELLSSAYNTDDEEKILEFIREFENRYENDKTIIFYNITLAQLYYHAGDEESAIEALEAEPTIHKFYYLGTLQMRLDRIEEGRNNLEKYHSELIRDSELNNKSADPRILFMIRKLLGYTALISSEERDSYESDPQMKIINETSVDELLSGLWP